LTDFCSNIFSVSAVAEATASFVGSFVSAVPVSTAAAGAAPV
jgi:hypothetical protein